MQPIRQLVAEIQDIHARHGRSIIRAEFWSMASYAFGRWANTFESPLAQRVSSKVYGLVMLGVRAATGDDICREACIGKDFRLVHSGLVRIHPDVVIGDRCAIMHGVTLGTIFPKVGVPRLGNDVFIGVGAKVLGPVRIGDGAHIAPNSLVVTDIPAGATAVGVPAKIFPRIAAAVAVAAQ